MGRCCVSKQLAWWSTEAAEDMGNLQSGNVQLHVHLEGFIRPETILELIREKPHLDCYKPGITIEDVKEMIAIKEGSLMSFLQPFWTVFIPVMKDDLSAIRRIAYECTEDCHHQEIVYCELRFAPQFMVTENAKMWTCEAGDDETGNTVREVVQAVCNGMKDGMKRYPIKMRGIVCGIRGLGEHFPDLVDIARDYHEQGIVGIDVAGDEFDKEGNEIPLDEGIAKGYQKAVEYGLGRTCHAGENGSAASVSQSINQLHCTRIGHGYHVLHDESVYDQVKRDNVHLELCLRSSVLTGSVSPDLSTHPAHRFRKDGVNYSLNTDDPAVTLTTIQDEYTMATTLMDFTDKDIARSNLNAAQSAFLPPDEVTELVEHVKKVHNLL